jgi:hypothetical protein
MFGEIYIQNQKVDTYPFQNISVIESVVDIKDISKNTNAFTRSFTVPATPTNNILFRHWYNANIDNSFDARTKQAGHISWKGKEFKVGTFRLQKANIKKGRIVSYTINFFGRLSSINKEVKGDELSVLDFTTLNHSYSPANVLAGLTNGITADRDVIYTALMKKQLYVNPDPSDNTVTDTLVNVSFDGGANAGLQWLDLLPSIRLIKIIEAIEAYYGFTFSRDFFGHQEFSTAYLWCNNSVERNQTGTEGIIDWDSKNGNDVWMNLTTNVGSYTVNSGTGERFRLGLRVTAEPGYETVPFTVRFYINDELDEVHEGTNDWNNYSALRVLQGDGSNDNFNYQVYFTVSSPYDFEYTAKLYTYFDEDGSGTVLGTADASANTQLAFMDIGLNLPKIKVIDFLKGIFSAYKLVILPTGEDTYYVDTIDNYYANGDLIDITDYVKFDEYPVDRGELFNEIAFEFQEGQTLQGANYLSENARGFGDEKLSLEDANGDPLDGKAFTLKLPFEQIPIERIQDQNDQVFSNLMYGASIDKDFEPIVTKPFIHYAIRTGQGVKKIGFFDGTTKSQLHVINNVSCASGIENPCLYSTTFSAERNPYNGAILTNNLYTNHYGPYIDEVFNIKKRIYKFTAILPERIQLLLSLNDVLKIKENVYRISKYAVNIATGETEFELFNFFSDLAVGQLKAAGNSESLYVDYRAQTSFLTVANLTGSSIAQVGLTEFDTSWLTPTIVGGQIQCVFDEYTNAFSPRNQRLDVTKNGNTISIFVQQNQRPLTVDNNVGTADNNILTSDNNY